MVYLFWSIVDGRVRKELSYMADFQIQIAAETDPNLLRMLDRGLDDIEAGRVLSHEDAMREVRRIRQRRREARAERTAYETV